MLSSIVASRSNRAYVLGAIGIVTVLGLLISVQTSLSYSSRAYTYDSTRKELLKAADAYGQDAQSAKTAQKGDKVVSYRKTTCRSSTWGPEWTVDSNGGVCKHGQLGQNGCCILPSAVPVLVTQLPLKPLPTDMKRAPLTVEAEDIDNLPQETTGSEGIKILPQKTELANSEDSNNLDSEKFTRILVREPEVKPTCSEEHQCCSQYEFCVSGCLDFTWQRLHSTIVDAQAGKNEDTAVILQLVDRLVGDHQAGDANVVKEYSRKTDLFDWCLLRCRTSGRSVVHQNSFRSALKHCYGLKDPPLLARVVARGETD